MSLKVSVSGVRGIVGESLTPALVMRFAATFGEYVGRGTVLVGRDARTTGPMFENAVVAGLLSVGCRPVLLGIVPTPTAQMAVTQAGASGAIIITASHNPGEWNALKLVGSSGIFLNHSEAEGLFNTYHQPDRGFVAEEAYRKVKTMEDTFAAHLDRVCERVDVEAIRKAGFKVAVDCCNGVGAFYSQRFLETLGCEVVALFDERDGIFRRPPEPTAANLSALCDAVRTNGCDVGFAQDPDGDRIGFVDETGAPLGEQNSFVLAAEHVLSRTPGDVVVNIDTTGAIEDVARKYGCRVVRTPVGEINVTAKMLAIGAVFGGEGGSGGVIWPAVHPCRDSFAGMALLLEMLAVRKVPLSAIAADLPVLHMRKGKTPCSAENAQRVVRKLAARHTDARATTIDGLRLDWEDGWMLIRASNTEPILRLTTESTNLETCEERIKAFSEEIAELGA